jgi:hypothetical protein
VVLNVKHEAFVVIVGQEAWQQLHQRSGGVARVVQTRRAPGVQPPEG